MSQPESKKARVCKGLVERLAAGETLVCAEGYLFELERRGYVQAGPFVPTCVLEHPEALRALHRDFLHCGTDVMEAFTYYAHREKLKVVGFEDRLEELNRAALRIAREVADEKPGTLLAGNVCNSTIWVPDVPETHVDTRKMFREQLQWAKEEGADFIIGETFDHTEEALCALEEIKAIGLPAVMMLVVHKGGIMMNGDTPVDALVKLKEAGAAVVGFNCARGPATMLPLLREASKCEALKGFPLAALPAGYSTHDACPCMQGLCEPTKLYTDADHYVCTRDEFADFTKEAQQLGCRFIGTCCGGAPHHVRAIASTIGKPCGASKYAPNIAKHYAFGLNKEVQEKVGTYGGISNYSSLDEKVKAYYAKMHELM